MTAKTFRGVIKQTYQQTFKSKYKYGTQSEIKWSCRLPADHSCSHFKLY